MWLLPPHPRAPGALALSLDRERDPGREKEGIRKERARAGKAPHLDFWEVLNSPLDVSLRTFGSDVIGLPDRQGYDRERGILAGARGELTTIRNE